MNYFTILILTFSISNSLVFNTNHIYSYDVTGSNKILIIKNTSDSIQKIDSVGVLEKSFKSYVAYKQIIGTDLSGWFPLVNTQSTGVFPNYSFKQTFQPTDSIVMTDFSNFPDFGVLGKLSAKQMAVTSDTSITILFYTSNGIDTVYANLSLVTSSIYGINRIMVYPTNSLNYYDLLGRNISGMNLKQNIIFIK